MTPQTGRLGSIKMPPRVTPKKKSSNSNERKKDSDHMHLPSKKKPSPRVSLRSINKRVNKVFIKYQSDIISTTMQV